MPFAKVEVADVEVILRAVAWTPPVNVDVEMLETTKLLIVVVPAERVPYKVVLPVTWRVEEALTVPENKEEDPTVKDPEVEMLLPIVVLAARAR